MIRISRTLHAETPLYPGTPPPEIVPFRSLEQGHSSSASLITVHSHTGTHLDAPRHFCPEGAPVAEVCGEELILEPALCLDLPGAGDRRILAANIRAAGRDLSPARALLIRTGAVPAVHADRSPAPYPWIDPGVPPLVRELCPGIRLLGVDTISVSSPLHRDEGRACHRAFLCGTPPILLLEDLDLTSPHLPGTEWRLRIIPWTTIPPDGVPVTAFLERPG